MDSKCLYCGGCVGICPSGAITLREKIEFHPELCRKCRNCINFCPVGALNEL